MSRLYAISAAIVTIFVVTYVVLYGADFAFSDADPTLIVPTDPDDLIRLVDANNQFAMDFYSAASSDAPGTNIFFSPWSIFTAFAIAFEGADGKAHDELQDVFGFIGDDTQRRTGFRSINDDLIQPDAEYKLANANALWLQTGKQIYPQYVDIVKTYYDSMADTVDLESQEGIDIINKWADENTNGKIKEIFPDPLPDAILAITNAIYFKGTWVTPFAEEQTRDMDFWLDSDNSIKTPMMRQESYFNYTRTDGMQILELPYNGDKISMLVLLPNGQNSIASLEDSLTVDSLRMWKSQLHSEAVWVTLPKFTLDTNYDLIPLLQSMGLERPFLEGYYNFPKIFDAQTWIANATHKAFVDVHEGGTEAAAATAITVSNVSLPSTFTADRPFIFIIQDTQTENILFIGKMTDPTQ